MARRPLQAPGHRDGRTTLRDVAAAAGTTPMTVSNVINGRAGQVSEALSKRVLHACKALGYRPHANARRLRTNRRQAIGFVIVDPSAYYASDPLTAAVLAGLNAFLGGNGYSTTLHGVTPDALENITLLREIESDGICLMLSGPAAQRRSVIERVRALGQPVLLLQEKLPDDIDDGAAVMQDDCAGGRAVAEHLFAHAARQVAMLVPTAEWPAMKRRENGVRDVLKTLPVQPPLHVVRCGDEGFSATQAAFAEHIDRHGAPDVLIGGNDQMAIAGMKLLQNRGLRVPEDVRVTGFNGLEFWRYATPELTTVFSPAYSIGEAAGEAMIERLSQGRFPFRERVLPVTFSAHRSSLIHSCQS
jgi:LacI family transcriptional regulator